MRPFFIFPIILLSFAAAPAQAGGPRNFFAPSLEGNRIAACLQGGKACGKPAADAFCRTSGYGPALMFQREPVATTRTIGSGEMCRTGTCVSFRQIKCSALASNSLAQLP
jgi:hypothetical protein